MMTQSNFSFPKSDRLCSHHIIEDLFTKGQSFTCYPFRIIYLETELEENLPSKILISVSKKRFKRAVHRNLLKRRCREAYRLNREMFIQDVLQSKKQIAFAMVYIASEQLSYSVIEKGMVKALKKLTQHLHQNTKDE